MFDDCTTDMRTRSEKMKRNFTVCNKEMEQKHYVPWSPLEKNKFLVKNKLSNVSYSRSVPRRNKQFVRYNMSRSLNSDVNVCGSSSENSSFEENKHMSRSFKIMKALNFHTSPLYFGKTKIKKSLNFNLTPSPKRFSSAKKNIQKASGLNFSPALSVSSKCSNLIKDINDSANSSIVFSSSESIDENQNETPLRRRVKKQETLYYSTPNTKTSTTFLHSVESMPLLRSRSKETIDGIVCITATTPDSQSLKCLKVGSKCADNFITNTSRNLFHEFHEDDYDRSQTPENVICIIPESMSAIKKSHKKERTSRRSGRSMQLANSSSNESATVEDTTKFVLTCEKKRTVPDLAGQCAMGSSPLRELSLCVSKDDVSDTGSLFDYAEELKSEKTSSSMVNCDTVSSKFHECNIKVTLEENITVHNLSCNEVSIKTADRPVTPELSAEIVLEESQKIITPENCRHALQRVAKNSIKKSHKKNKEANKTKFLSPKVLHHKLEATEEGNGKDEQNLQHNESVPKNKLTADQGEPYVLNSERACTPEKVNSSRLLLSQFSSVKKSHKKNKHTCILSGFLKRKEYFSKEIDSARDGSESDPSEKLNTTAKIASNLSDSNCSLNDSSDKLSLSKRKIPLNESSDRDMSVSCNSELQELDMFQEEFQIFTPLKRKRWLIASSTKEHLHFHDLLSGTDEHSEGAVANAGSSRCLTPVLTFQEHYVQSNENRSANNKYEIFEVQDNISNDKPGRSTPTDMSTAELFLNLDSIKKSHKKNKRGNNARKYFDSVRNDCSEKREWQNSSVEIRNGSLEKFELLDYDKNYLSTDRILGEGNNEQGSNYILVDKQNAIDASAEKGMQNVTPPNCLKRKKYIRLLRETSIKRSHKKVRDQKKYKVSIGPNELSDDGSIFGDDEKLIDIEY